MLISIYKDKCTKWFVYSAVSKTCYLPFRTQETADAEVEVVTGTTSSLSSVVQDYYAMCIMHVDKTLPGCTRVQDRHRS